MTDPELAGARWMFLGVALPTIGAASLALFLVQRSATNAWEHLLLDETGIGAQLVRETAGPDALDRTPLVSRWGLLDTVGFEVDATALIDSRPNRYAVAPILDADGWYTVSMLRIDPSRPPPRFPAHVWLAFVVSIGLLLAIARSWGRGRMMLARTSTSLTAAAVVLALEFVVADRWEWRVLSDATDQRLEVAVAALRSVDSLEHILERPGAVAQLTGTAFVSYDSQHRTRFSTLPPAPTADLEHVVTPTSRTMADRVQYAVADVGQIRLVALPYEHTGHARTAIAVVGLIGLMIAAMVATLRQQLHRPREMRRTLAAWTFLTPSAVHLAIFTFGPLAFAAWLSVHRWSLVEAARPLVWLDNYRGVLMDASFWRAIRNTALFALHVPFAMCVALALALLVHRPARGVVALRTLLFLPTITSLVAISVVWQWMFNQEYGLINWMFALVGLPRIPWLTSPQTALISLMIMAVWLVVGYQVVLFQAGLTTISRDLYDAARIDGAGPLQRFVHVTLPGLRPTIFFVLITSVIGSFQVFGAVYVMTEGGPLRSTDVAVYHIYEEAWEFLRFGNAAAMSWILFAIIFVVTWLHFRMLERRMA